MYISCVVSVQQEMMGLGGSRDPLSYPVEEVLGFNPNQRQKRAMRRAAAAAAAASNGRLSRSNHDDESSEEETYRESGGGILEFSPEKAGQDITPANFNFPAAKEREKRQSGTFTSIAGEHGARRAGAAGAPGRCGGGCKVWQKYF